MGMERSKVGVGVMGRRSGPGVLAVIRAAETDTGLLAGPTHGHLHGRVPTVSAEHLWCHPLPAAHLGSGHRRHHGVLLHGLHLLLLCE